MCTLWTGSNLGPRTGPEAYGLRVQDRLEWNRMPTHPYYAHALDPFTLLPERYWPMVMDLVLEVKPPTTGAPPNP